MTNYSIHSNTTINDSLNPISTMYSVILLTKKGEFVCECVVVRVVGISLCCMQCFAVINSLQFSLTVYSTYSSFTLFSVRTYLSFSFYPFQDSTRVI